MCQISTPATTLAVVHTDEHVLDTAGLNILQLTRNVLCNCSKHSEFALWAADVQKLDVEILPKNEEKELFKSFMEDFNTGEPVYSTGLLLLI